MFNYTPTTLGIHSWREIISGGTRKKKRLNTRRCFQQDGATAHTAQISMALLCDAFDELLRVLSRDIQPTLWPDLSPSDSHPRGARNASVYRDNPRRLRDLKQVTTNFITNIPHVELVRAFANEIKRADACLKAVGTVSKTCCNLV
jgi:hypothetical protein